MEQHWTFEDMERYLKEDDSEEELLWLEHAQEHLATCLVCQKKLQQFLLSDAVTREFPARALEALVAIEQMIRDGERVQQILAYFARTPQEIVIRNMMQQGIEPLYINLQAAAEAAQRTAQVTRGEAEAEQEGELDIEAGIPYQIRYADSCLQLYFWNNLSEGIKKIRAVASYMYEGKLCCDMQEITLQKKKEVLAFQIPSGSTKCQIYIETE